MFFKMVRALESLPTLLAGIRPDPLLLKQVDRPLMEGTAPVVGKHLATVVAGDPRGLVMLVQVNKKLFLGPKPSPALPMVALERLVLVIHVCGQFS